MIKVTLGDKPQTEENDYPKLMKGDQGRIILVVCKPNEDGIAPVFVLSENNYSPGFSVFGGYEIFTDYNEPVTIQNV